MIASKPALIVVVGSVNMDLVLTVARAPIAGETVIGRALSFVPGGKGANQAVASARLGGKVAMVGRIGTDDTGSQLLKALLDDGIDVEHLTRDAHQATGTALVLVEDSGENRITIVPGANETLTPAILERAIDLIDSATLVAVQLETPLETVAWAIERASRAGARTILNAAPARTLPEEMWHQLDYLIVNESEASKLTTIEVTDSLSAATAAREMTRRGANHVLITLGSKGVLVHDAQGARSHPAPRVQVVDTTAAGDTFVGGVAAALSDGKDIDQATKLGIEAASLSVTRRGAQPSIPYRHEIMARLGSIDVEWL